MNSPIKSRPLEVNDHSEIPKIQKYWSPNVETIKSLEIKSVIKPIQDPSPLSTENSLFDKKTTIEFSSNRIMPLKPLETTISNLLTTSKSIERSKTILVDPKLYKKNSYEIFKLLKTAIRKLDLIILKISFNRFKSKKSSNQQNNLDILIPKIKRALFKMIIKRRKSNSLFQSKSAELNDLKILVQRSKLLSPHQEMTATVHLLQNDLIHFLSTGMFKYDQSMIDEHIQLCLQSEANSETPQVLASESVSSIHDNLKLIKKKLVYNESLKDYSNTFNQSSQMTNIDHSVSRKNMFKKFQKNNQSESRANFKPRIESAKINFINIKSKIDCWNVPAKKNKFPNESESQLNNSEAKDLSKLREKFKSQYSKPFLKSIKRLENNDNESIISNVKNESVNIYQNKLVPKITFNDFSNFSKKSSLKREMPNKPMLEFLRSSKPSSFKASLSLKNSVVIPQMKIEPKSALTDKLTFEEIKDTYANKYLVEFAKVLERSKKWVPSKVDNFDGSKLLINGKPMDSISICQGDFHEISNFVNRRFDKIANA